MRVWCVLVAAAVVGCYSPDVRDCTVTCAQASDCADGQSCTAGYCVSDATVDACRVGATSDAGATTTRLTITITGHGRVTITNLGTCDSETDDGVCVLALRQGAIVTTKAIETDDSHAFEHWTTPPCLGQSETCQFTPSGPALNLGAKFQ